MIEAVVQTGRFETPYRRAGSGGVVLLLTGPTEPSAGDWLFGQLAGCFRTIAPALPAELEGGSGTAPALDERGIDEWLRGLIDGLGLERPALVASATQGTGLLRFMALDPDRVGRLALIQSIEPGEVVPADVAPGELGADGSARPAPHPVLVVGLPAPADGVGRSAALDRLVRFLAASP
jgi:pimeloyl-ACP methyl ester carboxylesterase